MSGGPLQGIRVVECAGYLSAPTACYMLGDLGAEIIKVEDREKGIRAGERPRSSGPL